MIPSLVTDALAAYRLTRLVTTDTITEGPRSAVVRHAFRNTDLEHPQADWFWIAHYDDPTPAVDFVADRREAGRPVPKLAELVTCRWCAGVWVAFGVVVARTVAPRLWDPVARALAVSAAAALVAGLEQ